MQIQIERMNEGDLHPSSSEWRAVVLRRWREPKVCFLLAVNHENQWRDERTGMRVGENLNTRLYALVVAALWRKRHGAATEGI